MPINGFALMNCKFRIICGTVGMPINDCNCVREYLTVKEMLKNKESIKYDLKFLLQHLNELEKIIIDRHLECHWEFPSFIDGYNRGFDNGN